MRPPVTRWGYDNEFARMVMVTIAFLTGVAVLSGVLPTSEADAQVPGPTITVSTSYGSIWAESFTPDDSVTITIDSTEIGTWPTDEWGNFDGNNYGLTFDVSPGSTVYVNDGTNFEDLYLEDLSATLDTFDEASLTVTGTTGTPDTPAGPMLMVRFGPAWRSVEVIGGEWTADFENLPADPADGEEILPSFGAAMGGSVSVADVDGDTTQWNWSSASIHASPVDDYLWVNGFAPGEVSLTIGGTPVDPSPVADQDGHFYLDFASTGIDLQPIQEIVAHQNPWTAEVTLVDLAVTDVNTATGVVSGNAPAGALVDVHAWTYDGGYASRVTTAIVDNTFSVSFSIPGGPDSWGQDVLALDPGTDLRAHIYDDRDLPEHDATISDWHIPRPRFKARVDDNGFSGWDWTPNSTVTVTVDSAPTFDFLVDEWGSFDGEVDIDLVVGQYVEAGDGVLYKDFIIRNLVITDIDADNDLVHGTSEANDLLHIGLHTDQGNYREVTADSSGVWTADFSAPWEDQDAYDIVLGTSGNAHYWEPDGDETQRTFRVSDPYITAQVIHEEIWATDFPDEPAGQVLYYRLNDPATAEVDFESDMPLIVSNGWTEAGDRSFGRYDVQAGQILTIRNRPFDQPLGDGMERVLNVSHIEVTGVDGDADTIWGYADPLEGDYVCVWSQDEQLCSDQPSFTWNGDGTWLADFGAVGSDVKPGHWNAASQYEDDGDETHHWWNLPPWVVVEQAQKDDLGNLLWPDAVRAESWTGPVVTLTINGGYVDEWTGTGDYRFELPGVDIVPGDVVTLSDSTDSKTITVRPLTVDQINFADDSPPNAVYGTADPYQNLRVHASASVGGWWAERWVNGDDAGDYVADFDNPGNGWREQWTADFGGAEGLGRNMYAEFYDEENDRVETFTCQGVPRLEIARSDGRVDAIDFPEGATVTLEIDDPATPEAVDYTDSGVAVRNPDNPCETIVEFDLGEFEVPDDATVEASDGTPEGTVTTVVVAFTIDGADPETDTVSGTAPVGADVWVQADGDNWRYVTAEDDGGGVGYWVADFSQPGSEPGEEYVVDLAPGSSGIALLLDENGSTTERTWRISNAQFQVDASSEGIWGNEWEPNAELTITVNGVDLPGGLYSTDGWGNFGFGWDVADLDLLAGDYVAVFDGVTTKDHTVTDLLITGVDPDSDVVTGMAEPGSSVDVWEHQEDNNITVVACDDSAEFPCDGDAVGTWHASFSGLYDLQPGNDGNSDQCDAERDCTNAGWRIPNAQFQVDASSEGIWGNDFERDAGLSITVNGVDLPGGPYSADGEGNFGFGWDPLELDLQPGDYVEVFDGVTTKDHTVTDLMITGVDPVADVVSGMATPGSTVDVWVHDVDNVWRTVIAEADGTWFVDFGDPGDDPGEENTADLLPGSNGNSGQCDAEQDCTNAGWQATPLPWVTGDAGSNQIWGGGDWSLDTEISISIDDPDTVLQPDVTMTVWMEPTEWDPSQHQFNVFVGDDIDLQPGFEIVATDPVYTKTLTLTTLAITEVDVDANTVLGDADDGYDVYIDGGNDEGNDWAFRLVSPSSGAFIADFGVPGSGENEQTTVDLVPGSRGTAQQYDEDGDYTHAFWGVDQPPWISTTWGGTLPGMTQVDLIQGWDWSEGEPIHVTIANVSAPGTALFEWDMTVGESMHADPPWWFEYRNDLGDAFELHLDGVFDIGPGHVITVASADWEKSVEVVHVTIDVVDLDNDVVQGSAPDDIAVDVWAAHEHDGERSGYRITGGEAAWSVDFAAAPLGDEWGNADLDLGWIISTDVWDEDGDTSVIDRYVPNPTFSVETLFDVWSSSDRWNHWPEGTPVEIVVDDDDDLGNGHKFVHETSVEWWGEAPWEAGFGTNVEPDEILPGDVVHVTIGDTTKVLHVQDITIDTVDEESDLVEGYATPGERVEVNVGNEEGGAHRSENADDDTGYWQANFSLPGDEEHEQDYWDIVPGTDVSAQVYDEDGDSTHRGFRSDEPALPSFSVRMSDQQVHGYEWSEGEPVSLEIDDPGNGPGVDYEADGWPEPAEWDSEQTFVWFGPFEDTGFEMFPGFGVTMTQGDVTKSHTVTDLVVTEVNSASDTVAGAATALGWIDVHIHDTEVNRTVQADGSGLWIADFSVPGTEDWEQEVHDIEPGTSGEANEPDEDGDSTQHEWHLAGLPEFGVSATHDWIEGYDFEGEEITFTVDDDDSPGNGVLHEETIYVDPGEPNWIYLIDGFDVEAGQFVTVMDGVTTKTTWVSPIEITEVDTVNWTVSGVADPDVVIDTFGFHPEVGGFGEHMIEVDGSGEWTLDLDEFFDPGDRPAEIPEGMLLGGGQRDDDSDRTIMFWDPAVVDGYVMAGGVPVVGGEVFFQGTIGAQHTCTDSTGYYRFENVSVVKALVSQGVAATGRAVNPDVACSNPDFVDDAGHPLVTAYVVGPFDLQDGYEHIPFDVVRAEAYQRVEVAEFDGADWLPADNVLVRAYDRNDPEFDATFGSDPDPEDYGAIWESGIGEFGLDFTGVYLLEDSGSVELRYPHLTDYLVLVEYVDGEILGQTSDAAEFADDGAGVYVGPTLYFPAQPNTAPEIVSFEGPVDPYALGWEGFVTGEFVDPDAGDTFTVEVDWGDGTTTTPDYDFVGGVGSFDDSHFYTAAGIYTITLTVRDASGAEAIAEYDSAVVFDPSGKSISGSPQVKIGDVSDKINFNIKYNKKTGDPKGHLKYTHKVKSALENVKFRADEIDYMWIFGDWAATAGRGALDSTGEMYEFALVVFDGKNTGVDDMFRFKLWNAETGDVFYDSQPGDPLLAFPTTVPTQGSIKVK